MRTAGSNRLRGELAGNELRTRKEYVSDRDAGFKQPLERCKLLTRWAFEYFDQTRSKPRNRCWIDFLRSTTPTGNGEKQIGRAYGAPRQPSTLPGTKKSPGRVSDPGSREVCSLVVAHAFHTRHATGGRAANGLLVFLLGQLRDQSFGREHEPRDGTSVLERIANDLGGIDDPGVH